MSEVKVYTIVGGILGTIMLIGFGVIIYDMSFNYLDKNDQVIVHIPTNFVLESKEKIKIPELADCTLYTLIDESLAYPIRVIRCAGSTSTQVNDNISTVTE